MLQQRGDALQQASIYLKTLLRRLFGCLSSVFNVSVKYVKAIFKVLQSTPRYKGAILVVAALFIPLGVLFGALNSNTAQAATSTTITFQGRLLTSTGTTVPDGSYNMQFNLYTVASGGSTQWTDSRLVNATQGITLKNGYFSVNLADTSVGGTAFPSTINWDQEQWLGLTVRGTNSCTPFSSCATPADGEMTPRFKLTSVPFAKSAAQLQNTSGSFTSTVNLTTPTANRVILFPDAGGTAILQTSTFTTNGVVYANANSTAVSTAAGTTGQCLVATSAAAPSWGSCAGSGSGVTLQAAYDNSTTPATITTADAKNILFTLSNTATDPNFLVNIATSSTGKFAVQNNGTDVLRVDTTNGVDLGSTTTGLRVATTGALSDIDANLVLNDTTDIGSATTGINITTAGALSDIDGNLILNDTTDIGSGTTGLRIATTGFVSDIDGSFTIDDAANIGSATTGISITTAGAINDIDGDLVLNDQLQLGGATGLQVTTAGVITDIDGASVTVGENLTVTAGGITVTAGDLALTAGNLTTNGTQRLSNAGALGNITGYSQTSGTFTLTSVTATGNTVALTNNSLTTGSVLNVTSSSNPAAIGPVIASQFNTTNANATTATTITGAGFFFNQNPTIAGNTEYAVQIQNQVSTNVTDTNLRALLYVNNADTTATGTTQVQNAIEIANTGGSGYVNLLASPSINITAAGAISGATSITASGLIQGGTGAFTATGSLTLGTASSASGQVLFRQSASANTVTLQAPVAAIAGNFTLSIPTIAANDTLCLSTLSNCTAVGAASGALTGTYPGPTLAGVTGTGAVPFQSATTGVLATDSANFFFDATNKRLGVGTATVGTNRLTVNNAATTDNIFVAQDNGTAVFTIGDGGNVIAGAVATGTTGTTSGAGNANTTTITLALAGAFANNDIIFVDNTGGSGQDYYTRITAGGGTTTLTVSPAVSYGTNAGYTGNATITKYTAQNLGATSTDYATQTNRFFQGYFLGGVVTGAGSTTLSDGILNSTTALALQTAGTTRLNVTSSGNVGIGNTNNTYPLDVTGNINSSTGFRVGGTAGATTTCAGGNIMQNQVVSGGIVTGGSCSAAGTGTITGSGTAGQAAYFTASGAIGSSANFLWDNTNSRLGIGTTPTVALDVAGQTNTRSLFIKPTAGTASLQLQDGTPTTTSTISLSNSLFTIANNANPVVLNANTNGGNTSQLYLATSGNIGIGTAAPLAPGGANARVLQVSGVDYPQYIYAATGATADNKIWRSIARSSGTFELQTLSDAGASEITGLQFVRSGNSITNVNLPSGTLTVTGAAVLNSTLAVSSRFTVNSSGYLSVADAGAAAGDALLRVGDDTFFSDVDVADTLGLYSAANNAVGRLRFGSSGGLIGSNTYTTYAALTVDGVKNTYSGINFRSGGTNLGTFMVRDNGSSVIGFYNRADTGWDWYWDGGVLAAGTVPTSRITGLGTMAGQNRESVSGQGIAYGAALGPEVLSQGGGAAGMTFHRPGAYAVNFGLNTNNMVSVGGWSMGAVSYSLVYGDNYINTGNITTNAVMLQGAAVNCALIAGGLGNIGCASDERLKDLHGLYEGGLDELNRLNTIRFNYKNESYIHVGFSAQNVQTVLPEGTPTQKDGFLGFDSNAVLALLVNSVKELDVKVNSNTARLSVLEAGNFSGNLSVAGDAQITGSLTVTGDTTLTKLTVTGDTEVQKLTINGKIISKGNIPTVTLGQTLTAVLGASITNSGTDTAGTVEVISGTQVSLSGEIAEISFDQSYATIPKIVISGNNAASAKLGAYVVRTATGFKIITDDPLQLNQTYSFDYIIVEATN